MLEYVTGNLLTADLPAIAHGCNTKGVMGSGIAYPISKQYPEMYSRYVAMCESGELILGDIMSWRQGNKPAVYNLMTQVEPGPNANLFGIAIAIRAMVERATILSERLRRPPIIGLPRIGAGIGGLEWSDVEHSINVGAMKYPDVQLIVYTLPEEVEKFA